MKKMFGWAVLLALVLSSCGKKETPLYRVALDPQWSTLDIKGREQNLLGFTMDAFKKIADEQGVQFELLSRNWDNLTDGLMQKKYEGMLTTIYPYLFNQQTFDFSELFLATGPVLVVGAHSTWDAIDALRGKEVGVQAGSRHEILLEGDPSILPRVFESVPQALNAVANGEIEGALVDVLVAQAYCNDLYKDRLKIATAPLNDQGLRLLTLHGKNGYLIEQFNEGLSKLKKQGTFQELQTKWFLSQYCPQ